MTDASNQISNAVLITFLRDGSSVPFEWGKADCCLWPSDYMAAKRGVDPAASLRGRYRTMIGALRHIKRLGGFEPMVRTLMTDAGFVETDDPQPGDVGVITSAQGPALAIKTKIGWAAKGKNGIVCAPFECLVAWKI